VSQMAAALRRTGAAVRPALRGWRMYALGAVALLLLLGVLTLRFHVAGIGASGAGASSSAAGGAAGGGASGGGGAGGSGGGAQANAANGGQGGSGSGSSGANPTGSPKAGTRTPPPSSAPLPTPADSINGTADVLQSDCGGGYEPGSQCNVYYHGLYDLVSQPTAKLVIEVIIDGTVSGTQTYVAPPGGHRFGAKVTFTVPPHAKKIVYQSFLEDATGKVIVASKQQTTAGYG